MQYDYIGDVWGVIDRVSENMLSECNKCKWCVDKMKSNVTVNGLLGNDNYNLCDSCTNLFLEWLDKNDT